MLIFNLEKGTLEVARIGADVAGKQRLQQLLGRTVHNPAAALAASLHCQQADVAAILRKRGDHNLADLIPESRQLGPHTRPRPRVVDPTAPVS